MANFAVAFETSRPEIAGRVAQLAGPWIKIESLADEAAPEYCVRITDAQADATPKKLLPPLRIHNGTTAERWEDREDQVVRSDRFMYRISPATSEVQLTPLTEDSEMIVAESIRVIRSLLMSQAEEAGFRKLHMTMLRDKHSGVGVGLAAPPHGGKTTFLMAELSRPGTRFSFVSNDKVLLAPDGRLVYGLPYAVGLRPEVLGFHRSRLTDVIGFSASGRSYRWPSEIASSFGIALEEFVDDFAICRVQLVPRLSPTLQAMSAEEVTRTSSSIWNFTDDANPRWIMQMLEPGRGARNPGGFQEFDGISWGVVGDPESYPVPDEIWDQIIAKKQNACGIQML